MRFIIFNSSASCSAFKLGKYPVQGFPDFLLPVLNVFDLRLIDGSVFIEPAGDLVDVVGQVLQQPYHLTDFGKIQLQHVPIQGNSPVEGRLILDAVGLHFLPDQCIFGLCRPEVVVHNPLFFLRHHYRSIPLFRQGCRRSESAFSISSLPAG